MSDEINLTLDFEANALLPDLFGEHNRNLARLEQMLDVTIHERGNQVIVVGDPENVNRTKAVLDSLYARLKNDMVVGSQEVDGAIRMAIDGDQAPHVQETNRKIKASLPDTAMVVKTRKKNTSRHVPAYRQRICAQSMRTSWSLALALPERGKPIWPLPKRLKP